MALSKITLTFSKTMSDPTGKESEFNASIGGTPGDYQQWENYTNSPVLTVDYPNQIILIYVPDPFAYFGARLYCSAGSFYQYSTTIDSFKSTEIIKIYAWDGADWIYNSQINVGSYTPLNVDFTISQSNVDVWTDSNFNTIYFAQTTPPSITSLTIDSITQPTSTTYQLNTAELLTSTDVITCDYTQGTVTSADGGILASFSTSVINNV